MSRALSKPGRVSFATAERIRRAAEDLGCRSGAIRPDLLAARTRMLAMIVPDITNPVFSGTPLVTLGVTAINHLLSTAPLSDDAQPVLLPVRLVVRDSTAPTG